MREEEGLEEDAEDLLLPSTTTPTALLPLVLQVLGQLVLLPAMACCLTTAQGLTLTLSPATLPLPPMRLGMAVRRPLPVLATAPRALPPCQRACWVR